MHILKNWEPPDHSLCPQDPHAGGWRDRERRSAEEESPGGGEQTRLGLSHCCSRSNGPGGSGTPWEARTLGLRRPRLGVDQARESQKRLLLVIRPSSCGHCPVHAVNSAQPVVTALPSALASDPLVSRTLDTFCFERKQTLLKLPLGGQTARLSPSLGGWWMSGFRGNLTGEAACAGHRPHQTSGVAEASEYRLRVIRSHGRMGREGHRVRGTFQEVGQHVREMLQWVSRMN